MRVAINGIVSKEISYCPNAGVNFNGYNRQSVGQYMAELRISDLHSLIRFHHSRGLLKLGGSISVEPACLSLDRSPRLDLTICS